MPFPPSHFQTFLILYENLDNGNTKYTFPYILIRVNVENEIRVFS